MCTGSPMPWLQFATLFLISIGTVSGQITSVIPQVNLAANPNPVVYGQPVTLTATLLGYLFNGKVTFYDGVDIIGIVQVTTGPAVMVTSALTPGTHSLHA